MTVHARLDSDARPDLTRTDVGVVKAGTWRVGTPERQRAAVDAIRKTWQSRAWPDSGILSYTVYTGEDGDTLFHYSQWRSEQAFQDFFARHRGDRNGEIDAAVPGIERVEVNSYELYRAKEADKDDPRVPGSIVVVDVMFDGPDADRQRDWVDGVFEALATDPNPHPGGISGHFHISVDGTRVLNYAEWESAEAHIEALAAPGDGIGADTPQWRKVQNYPGVVGGGVKRYTPALSLSPGVS
ncbi:antibiotic biosynthesis monooxygenase [Streptomyces purpureus]|uniref:Antibiotic biosynthesis monooxygenase n=1 Tax=Streptomyces purpureus TaxID=1951 RepID=A0A918GYM5_9ACTN|nr:antibiotic biosynthesis monooxygenase [Streptomyces purpureus]GGT24460.1 antibiotic biosynthesis monooxygenase [Streptomyces purpureus]